MQSENEREREVLSEGDEEGWGTRFHCRRSPYAEIMPGHDRPKSVATGTSMQTSAVMAVAMADEEPPVFHDFLGIAGQRRRDAAAAARSKPTEGTLCVDAMKELQASDKASMLRRTYSMNSGRVEASVVVSEQLSWPTQRAHSCGRLQEMRSSSSSPYVSPEAYSNRHGKRKDMITDCGNHVQQQQQPQPQPQQQQQQQQRGMENAIASSTPYPPKVRRAENSNEHRSKVVEEASRDESAPSMMMMMMQPPPLWAGSQNVLHSSYGGIIPGPNPKYMTMNMDKMMIRPVVAGNMNNSQMGGEKATAAPSTAPPADEGSRTGLKGSSISCLQNSSSNNNNKNNGHGRGINPPPTLPAPPPPIPRCKSLNQATFSDSTHPLRTTSSTPVSRQLTIFYGGQAHVFEDVSSEKLDAIMALACSSGRSWSTTYNPRSESSAGGPSSGGSGSLTRPEGGSTDLQVAFPLSQHASQSGIQLSPYHRHDSLGSSRPPDSGVKHPQCQDAGLEVLNRM